MEHPALPNPNEPAQPRALIGDCSRCGELVEYVSEGQPHWQHRGPIPDPPHPADPINKRAER